MDTAEDVIFTPPISSWPFSHKIRTLQLKSTLLIFGPEVALLFLVVNRKLQHW
jgi:hypothetical protein